MKPPTDTIEILRSALQTGVVSRAVEQAASLYAQLCQDCAARLDRIEVMLEKGSDYQALQSAEEEPPLLDLIGHLSFGGEKAWFDFCQAHQLPLAPRIAAKTVQALDKLYAQGVTANHPLYKDFRAAVLSRDYPKALRTVRTILKLNPQDENARSEWARLENKAWQEQIEQLREALKTDDEAHIAQLVTEMERTTTDEKRLTAPEVVQAKGVRRALESRKAAFQLPQLLEACEKEINSSQWDAAEGLWQQADELQSQFQLELSSEQRESLQRQGSSLQKKRAEKEKQRHFERDLRQTLALASEAEKRLASGAALGLREAQVLDSQFVRQCLDLQAHGIRVPEEQMQRLSQMGQKIRSRLEQVKSQQRTRNLSLATILFFFLLGVAAVAWHGWQARAYALDLHSFRVRGLSEPAQGLLASLRSQQGSLLHWPYLRTQIEETQSWLEQSISKEKAAHSALQQIEGQMQEKNLSLAQKGLLDLQVQISQLPADLGANVREKAKSLQNEMQSQMKVEGQSLAEKVQKQILSFNQKCSTELSYEQPTERVREALHHLQGELAEIKKLMSADLPGLAPLLQAGAWNAAFKQASERLSAFQRDLLRYDEATEKAMQAGQVDDFRKALQSWQNLPFVEASQAATALTYLPSEKQMLAQLLTDGSLELWEASLSDQSGSPLYPEAPEEDDLKLLLSLRDDRYLNGIWENEVQDLSTRRGARIVWSQGPLKESRVGDTQRRWFGSAYDPHPDDSGAAFTELEFKRMSLGTGSVQGQNLTLSRVSATSRLLQALQLDRMTDANGERFERSLLSVMDKLVQDAEADPIAKAYLMQQLARPLLTRSHAWGLHLCPSLRADLGELQKLIEAHALRSEDWLVQQMQKKLGPALAAFFQRAALRQYENEAKAMRALILQVNGGGVKLAGFVTPKLEMHLIPSAHAVSEIWAVGAQGPVCLSARAKVIPESVAALSALFYLPVDRVKLIHQYQQMFSPIPPPLPASPFFQPK